MYNRNKYPLLKSVLTPFPAPKSGEQRFRPFELQFLSPVVDGSRFSVYIPAGTSWVSLTLGASSESTLRMLSEIPEIPHKQVNVGYGGSHKVFIWGHSGTWINSDNWTSGKWVFFEYTNGARPVYYYSVITVDTDHPYYCHAPSTQPIPPVHHFPQPEPPEHPKPDPLPPKEQDPSTVYERRKQECLDKGGYWFEMLPGIGFCREGEAPPVNPIIPDKFSALKKEYQVIVDGVRYVLSFRYQKYEHGKWTGDAYYTFNDSKPEFLAKAESMDGKIVYMPEINFAGAVDNNSLTLYQHVFKLEAI